MLAPVALDVWRERMRDAMLSHPQHHLNWRLRQAFYLELGQATPQARAFRGWLAILCAQKVLPVALGALPHEPLPFRLLSTALAVQHGFPPAEHVQRVKDDAYHFQWHEGLDGKWHWNAERAVFTAYKALLEVEGWLDPFAGFGPQWTSTVESEVHSAGSGDAVSSAAVAWACSADHLNTDPLRLREFWEWWLDQVWLAAQQLAERFPGRAGRPVEVPPFSSQPADGIRPEPFGEDDWPESGLPPEWQQ